jgi:hypothetical protein
MLRIYDFINVTYSQQLPFLHTHARLETNIVKLPLPSKHQSSLCEKEFMMTANSRSQTRRSIYATLIGLLSLLLGGIGAFVFTADPPDVRLAADTTIQRFVVLTFYIGFVISLIGYRLLIDEQEDLDSIEKLNIRQTRHDWVGRIAVSFAVAWILSAVCQAVFILIIGKVFAEVTFPRAVMMFIFAIYSSVLGFGVAFFIVRVGGMELTKMLAALAIGGLLFSVTIVTDFEWWRRSVSALGIDPTSGTFFNITIILAGLVALTLARDLIADLKLLTEAGLFPQRGFDVLRHGITGTCLGITGVGLFPTEGLSFSNGLHLLSAYGMAILFILGMLFIDNIAPNIYPKPFVYAARGLGVVSILLFVAHLAGYLAFVPMELMLFTGFGVWVFYFRFETKQYIRKQVLPSVAPALG